MLRVCVTGPESTGKTTLAGEIALALDTECVPEAARIYAERVGPALTASDVEPIAREHIALADAAAERVRASGGNVVVLDTDLLSTVVYAQYYYEFSSPWLESKERARRADLYLLCDVDVPWIADAVRDRPANREEMLELFRSALEHPGARYEFVTGDLDARLQTALGAIRAAR